MLKLLVDGRNGKEIAADLAISPETVRKHVQSFWRSCKFTLDWRLPLDRSRRKPIQMEG